MKLLAEKIQKRVEDRVHKSIKSFKSRKKPDELKRYVTRAIQLGRLDLAAEMVEAKVDRDVDRPELLLERIINENQLTGTAFFQRGLRAARAVGRVVVDGGSSFGTGFMISPQLMMTNNHVLRTANEAARSKIEFDFVHDLSGRLMRPKVFRFRPRIFFRTNREIDYTVVAVEPRNAEQELVESRGWLHLIRQSGKAVLGERLNIIQHPDAKPQMIALRENTLVGVDGFFLHYATDTRPGSSGSPVMNDQFQLAALHHAGVPDRDEQGRILKTNGRPFRRGNDDPDEIKWIANEGARVSEIVADLSSRSLSREEKEMFERAFEMFPFERDEAPSPTPSLSPGLDPSEGGMSAVPVMHDGIARWNFQLTFGPTRVTVSRPSFSGTVSPTLNPIDVGVGGMSSSDMVASPGSSEDNEYYNGEADGLAASRYYEDIDPDGGPDDLFQSLSALLKDTHEKQFSYRTARHGHLYPLIDRHPEGDLRSVYSNDVVSEEAIRAEMARFERAVEEVAAAEGLESSQLSEEKLAEIDLVLETNGPFNCEHVVPQSWFHKKQPMKADLHHLFTCEPRCNSFRSNIPYWEFDDAESESLRRIQIMVESIEDLSQEGARAGCGIREGRKFEPETNKGAVARATLYFLLRYPGQVGDVKSGSKLELTKSRLEILLTWSDEDPPSLWEKHRNAEIGKSQGNRNPLIDHPDWARQINFNLGFG